MYCFDLIVKQMQRNIIILHNQPGSQNEVKVFKSVITSHQQIILDFFAEWCGPCKKMEATLHEIAAKNPQITICKIDVDRFPQLCEMYQIKSMPTFIFIRDAQAIGKISGYKAPNEFKSMTQKYFPPDRNLTFLQPSRSTIDSHSLNQTINEEPTRSRAQRAQRVQRVERRRSNIAKRSSAEPSIHMQAQKLLQEDQTSTWGCTHKRINSRTHRCLDCGEWRV